MESILNYNVPEPTSYAGKFLTQLSFAKTLFKTEYRTAPAPVLSTTLEADVESFTKDGIFTDKLKNKVGGIQPALFSGTNKLTKLYAKQAGVASLTALSSMATATKERMTTFLKSNKKLVFHKTLGGHMRTRVINKPDVNPAIYLVKSVALSNFLGTYGVGRTISTFTLLPGEKTTISIKTYKKTTSTKNEASSILDSYTDEKASDFEEAVQDENSNTTTKDTSFNYYADAEGSGNVGVVNVAVSAGVSGSVNCGMEEMTKNVSSAMKKESAKSSAKRDVEINTSSQEVSESGEESAIVRVLENINVSSTLNFVFRQMNQEFINILHLTDVRVGFFNGQDDSKIEVPLYDMDSLLSAVCIDAPSQKTIRDTIIKVLTNLKDYKGTKVTDFVTKSIDDGVEWYNVNKNKATTWKDTASGTEITVNGMILNVDKTVMRTDGVVVEALLGQGLALDTYSINLQQEKVKEKQYQNQLLQLEILERQKRLDILNAGDKAKGDLYALMFAEEAAATTTTTA